MSDCDDVTPGAWPKAVGEGFSCIVLFVLIFSTFLLQGLGHGQGAGFQLLVIMINVMMMMTMFM